MKQKGLSKGIALILLAAIMSSLSQLIWKLGVETTGGTATALYLLGFVLAGLGMFAMMAAFRYGQVSILQPMMSIGFAFSILFGALFLHESLTAMKVLGTVLIVAGAVLLGMEGKDEK